MAASKNIKTEIIVIDNCSSDGSKEYFEGIFPEVNFIWNIENIGFGRANNLALKSACGDHILFLNPDTIIPENAFEKCIEFFSANSSCGACGVRMIDGGGDFLPESKRRFPTIFSSFTKLIGSKQSSYYDYNILENGTSETEVLSGAFMMLSRQAIEVVNGFDVDFFMYGEDIDLSYRIYKEGFKNYYLGSVTIIHFKGESTNKFSKKYYADFYGAMRLFVKKHFNIVSYFFISPIISLAQTLAGMQGNTVLKKYNIKTHHVARLYVLCDNLNRDSSEKIFKRLCPKNKLFFIDAGLNITQNLEAVVADEKFISMSYLILCLPDISYSESIFITEKYQKSFYHLFHHTGSMSIAGIKNKNDMGNLFAESQMQSLNSDF